MILGQISYLDCLVFLVFLIPQLLLNVNVIDLVICGLRALPFLVFQLPFDFTNERYLTTRLRRSPFVQQATPFQDFVIRCVRYAFANMPSKIGRVFFSKGVASPFFTFRMLRHGYLHSPIPWREISIEGVRGLLIIHDESQKPDVVIYYCHGGGFSMGSAYFYLEPLLALQTLLKGQFKNPAIMALDYDLVPDASYPTQLEQTGAGYDYTLSLVDNDASCICVAGDSAGATLVLSLLLNIACGQDYATRRPGYATLISPWISLVSSNNRNTPSDFLNAQSLELYGRQYAGSQENLFDPLVSPGSCTDLRWWAQAVPANGIYITYGSEEVLGPETRNLVHRLRKGGVKVSVKEESGLIHAWVIARLFLEETMEERVKGMRELVKMVRRNIRAA